MRRREITRLGAARVPRRAAGSCGKRRAGCCQIKHEIDLLLTLATAGVGLNITNANKVIILEPFRFGSNEAQAAMRVHRIGQSRDVEIITFFTRATMDHRASYHAAHRLVRSALNVAYHQTSSLVL